MNIARPEENRSSQFLSDPNASSPPRTLARAAAPPQFQANPARLPLSFQTTFQDLASQLEPGNHHHRIRAGSVEQATLGQDHQYGHTWKPGSYEMAVRSQEKPTSLFFLAIGPGTGPISVTRAFEGHLLLLLLRSRIPPSPSGSFLFRSR